MARKPEILDEAGIRRTAASMRREVEAIRRREVFLGVTGLTLLGLSGGRAALGSIVEDAAPSAPVSIAIAITLTIGMLIGAFARVLARRVEALRVDLATLEVFEELVAHREAPILVRDPYREDKATSPRGVLVVPSAAIAHALEHEVEPLPAKKTNGGWGSFALKLAAAVTVVVGIAGAASLFDDAAPKSMRWTFTELDRSPTELGLETPALESGEWRLEEHAHATGAAALVNGAGAPNALPATALVRGSRGRDAFVATRCKIGAEGVTGGCGVVLRYQDQQNHYVARVDAAHQKIVLGVVSSGHEKVLGAVEASVPPGVWNELSAKIERERVVVYWNGLEVIGVQDRTHRGHGSFGLWASAASVAYFDELSVRPLAHSDDVGEFLPFMIPHDG